MDLASKAGGGSLPLLEIPSKCLGITIEGMTVNFIEKQLRFQLPPIIGRIESNRFILDLRTVREEEFPYIENAFTNLMNTTAR
jgi:L-seryl-tRNA(Ser) seleniumtransferase